MKRQAGGSSPDGGPAGAMDVMGREPGTGPAGYASTGDEPLGGAELLEDRTLRVSGGSHGRRFGISVPGALAGTFLVTALAFGAAFGPMAPSSPASDTAGHGGDKALVEPTDRPGSPVKSTDEPSTAEQPSKTDGPSQVDGVEKAETVEPTAAPAPNQTTINIGAALDGTAVVIKWSACEVDDFVAYKIIRSKDEYATWPLGTGDSLAGVIEAQGTTRLLDKAVDGGRTYRYRVIGLRTWEGEKLAGCSSETVAISTPAPPPKPQLAVGGDIAITVVLSEGHPFVDWAECAGVDFTYYKVIRSTDSTVTWPKGENDSMVTAVGKDGQTKAWDGEAPGGKTLYYRVFCVRSSEAGYVVVASSAVKSIETPAAAPAPDPVALGFEVNVSGEGALLHWDVCTGDGFRYYKVVRSLTSDNPSYLPWTDGTELIGVIENSGTTQVLDSSAMSGQTIYYRVQCIGTWSGSKILLGQTAVIAVTIP